MNPVKINVFSLTATMEQLGVPLEERSDLLQVSLARSIGYKLPIPTEPVEDAGQFFHDTFRDSVERTLAEMNERVVFDLGEITNCVGALWLFRYRAVHEPFNPAVREFLDAMCRVGADKFPTRMSDYMVRSSDDSLLDRVAGAVDASLLESSADIVPSQESLFTLLKSKKQKRIERMEGSIKFWEEMVEGFNEVIKEYKQKLLTEKNPEKRKRYETEIYLANIDLKDTKKELVVMKAQLAEIQSKKKGD